MLGLSGVDGAPLGRSDGNPSLRRKTLTKPTAGEIPTGTNSSLAPGAVYSASWAAWALKPCSATSLGEGISYFKYLGEVNSKYKTGVNRLNPE